MTSAEKRAAIARKQKEIDSYPWASTISYPYCCMCFERLTEHNIVEDDDGDHLIDLCLDCKDK